VAGGLFERIVCGVDSSPESLEAVRQSDLLLEPGGRLLLVAAVDVTAAVRFRLAPTAIHATRRALEDIEERDQEALAALEQARAEATHASEVATLETAGRPADCLLDAAAAERATLVAVGTHGLGRAAGVVLGSVATRILDRAPCSVIVARRRPNGRWLPKTVVVGADGSPAADAALRACRELETRFGSDVRPLTVAGHRPAHELVEAAAEADLIAVGGRAKRRARGLGSVAERVAHHADCSVLVVRGTVRAADD
jgi:nucleotide-binding universal stress UspA family protein